MGWLLQIKHFPNSSWKMEIVISELYLTGTYRASGLICRAWSLDTQSRVKPNFQTELRWAITVLQMEPGYTIGLND